jgi:hypothetical protein
MSKWRVVLAVALAVGCAALLAAQAQGPLTPPPKKETKRIQIDSAVEPPPIPAEEIIRRFAEKEAELAQLRLAAKYQISVRLVEFNEEGEPAGEFQSISQATLAADGKPIERILRQTQSTLKSLSLPPEDLEDLTRIPPFLLPAAQLVHYDLTYAGKQTLDELTTYIFRVQPKRLERRQRFFEGAIWVDDQDFAIVKTYGKFVTELLEDSTQQPFQLFETYRQLVDGKHWLPAYTRSEETIRTNKGEVRLRLTIRYEDYQLPATPTAKQN